MMDLLDTPLRVTWDLHGSDGAMPSAAASTVARALAAAGVFFVTLDERPLAHSALRDILGILADGACTILIVCNGTEEEIAGLGSDQPPAALLLNAKHFVTAGILDRDGLGRALEKVRRHGTDPGLLLTPAAGNIHLLPDLLVFARDSGVGRIKLPNFKIDASFCQSRAAELLRPADLDRLRPLLPGDPLALHAGIDLEVHDLFLWELLFPGRDEGRSEYGGCQAANSLGHVDAAGYLYPCSSWPESLGSLLQHSLAELWESPRRFQVRDEIASVPSGCRGCRDYPLCFGGCRGLSRTLCRDDGGRDPLCSGPR